MRVSFFFLPFPFSFSVNIKPWKTLKVREITGIKMNEARLKEMFQETIEVFLGSNFFSFFLIFSTKWWNKIDGDRDWKFSFFLFFSCFFGVKKETLLITKSLYVLSYSVNFRLFLRISNFALLMGLEGCGSLPMNTNF